MDLHQIHKEDLFGLAWMNVNVKVKVQWSRSPGTKNRFLALPSPPPGSDGMVPSAACSGDLDL